MNAPFKLPFKERVSTRYLKSKYRLFAAETNDRSLAKKYEKFARHDDIYTASIGAYTAIGRAFSSKELAVSQYGERPFYSNPTITFLQDIVKPSNPFSLFISSEKNWVETRLGTKEIIFSLDFSDAEKLGAAEKIIKSYFPSFAMPSKFDRADLEAEKGNIGRFTLGQRLTNTLSVEQISNIVPDFTSPNSATSGDPAKDREKYRFKLPSRYRESGFGKIAYLEMTMELDRALLIDQDGLSVRYGASGSLLTGKFKANIPLKVNLVYRWPWEFAQYATCASSQSDFVPFLFYQYTNWHRIAYAGKRTRGGGLSIRPPARISSLSNILKQIEDENKAGRIVKPRLNEDGFAILGTGEPAELGDIVWVDKGTNRISEYMEQIRSSYNVQDKKIDLSKLKIKGTSIFYDPNNEKAIYVREAGSDKSASDVSGIQTLDLTGSVALDDITIAKRLNERLYDSKDLLKDFGVLCYKALSGEFEGFTVTKPLNKQTLISYGFSDYDSGKGRDIVTEMFQTIAESPDINVTWAHVGGDRKLVIKNYDNDVTEGTPEAARYIRMAQLRAFCRLLTDLSGDLLRQFDKINVAYSTKVHRWRFLLTLITKYAKGDADYQTKLQTAIAKNTAKTFTPDQVLNIKGKINLPNLPGIKSLMPHQSETQQDLAERPPFAFIELTTGGGKTPMGLIDALNLMQVGEVKRPLVAVPSHLVKNWVSEIRKFSQGEVNVFIITIQTVRRLMQVYRGNSNPAAKPDYELIKKIILGCPPNTIFLTNFRFLSIDKEDIVYANSIVTRFYSAEFVREMGFDLVTYDESHGLKTLGSNQTLGTSIVASVAKYKRLMSGTLINNTLLDLVGQSALGNPSALGSKRKFESRYGASYSGDDDEDFTGEWRPDAASMIIEDMRPFVKRIIHKRDRIAFMLPQAVENFHQVSFTPLQKEFYDAMVARSFEELREKNPKLFAKMIDANEADDAAISSGLSTAFQEIERFNCAPDTFPDFLNLEGITEKDKISPKVSKIVELLDQHFQGTIDNQGEYVESPNQYKVIIFGNRRASSAHVFKWLPEKYKKIAVHYTAENKQASEIFERNARIRIMVADGASITSGLNLQFAARMIRLETVWAPGDLEQAFARIWRPDFATAIGEGRLKVFLDWLITSESLDVAKTGRIVSKLIEKQKYDRQEDPSFVRLNFTPSDAFNKLSVGTESMSDIIPQVKTLQPIAKMLDTLPLIKMNHATLADLREMGQLKEYFANYALVNDYEEQQFEKARKDGLQQLIPVPDECRSTIKGSQKLSFQNRVPGMNPDPFDPNGYFGYKPISIIDSEIALNELMELDEDDENYVEVNPVKGGELVDTEFGIGTISGILQNEVWVTIKGLGKVRVPKATAWLITNPVAVQGITATLKRSSIVRTPPGISDKPVDIYDMGVYPIRPKDKTSDDSAETDADSVVGAPKKTLVRFKRPVDAPPAAPVEDTPKKTIVTVKPPKPKFDRFDEDEDEDEDNSIEISAEIIDGQIALVCLTSDRDSDMLVQDYGFVSIPKYFAVEVLRADALDKLIDLLTSKFTIRDDYVANLQVYKSMLKSKRLNQATPSDFKNTMQFFREQKKTIKEGILRPYPIVWGDSLFIAMDFNKTPSIRKASQVIRSANIPGVKMIRSTDTEGMVLRFFKTNKDAIEALEEISGNVTVPNAEETKSYLQGIKKRNAPVEEKKVDTKTDTTSKPKIKVQVKAPTAKEKVSTAPTKTLVRFKRK